MSTAVTINGLTHALPTPSDAEWGGILTSFLHGLSYAKRGLLTYCASSGLVVATQKYLAPGYAAAVATRAAAPMPFTGTIVAVLARCAGTGGGPDANLALEVHRVGVGVGGADVAVAAGSILSGASSGTLTVSAGTVNAGEPIGVSCTPAAGFTSGGTDLVLTIVAVPS